MKLILVALPCVSSFFLGLRPAPAPSAQCHVRMVDPEATRDSEGSYEEYIADRASGKTAGGSIEDSAAGYESFEKYNLDFDGGDSGGGVVGDGNTDLEDQHKEDRFKLKQLVKGRERLLKELRKELHKERKHRSDEKADAEWRPRNQRERAPGCPRSWRRRPCPQRAPCRQRRWSAAPLRPAA